MKDLGITVEETIIYIGNLIKPSMVTTIKVPKEFRRRPPPLTSLVLNITSLNL